MRIAHDDIRILQEQFLTLKDSMESEIEVLRSHMIEFAENTEIFDGEAAAAMRRYIQEVHGEILRTFLLTLVTMDGAIKKYISTFQNEVDESIEAAIETEYVDQVIQQTKNVAGEYDLLQDELSAFVSRYAEFLPEAAPSDDQMQTAFYNSETVLNQTIDLVSSFDSYMADCFDEVKELLQVIDAACETDIKTSKDKTDLQYPINFLEKSTWYKDFIKYLNPEYAKYLVTNPSEQANVFRMIRHEQGMSVEDIKKINEFMQPLETGDTLAIKLQAYTADETFCKLFIRYLDRFAIADTSVKGVFNSSNDTLVFNIADDRNNPRGTYYTFFHEVGHAIDYYYGVENGYKTNVTDAYKNAEGLTLSDANRLDVEARLSDEIDVLLSTEAEFITWSQQNKSNAKEAVLSNLMNYNLDETSLSLKSGKLHIELVDVMNTALQGADHESASDIYGGVTNNAIVGLYGHFPDKKTGEEYWMNSDGSVRRLTNKESFAEYYGRCMTIDPAQANGLKSIKNFMPQSEELINEILQEMSNV